MYRVVLTGSECTGKTTTAMMAAREMNVPWVPEAARVYAEAKGSPLAFSDVSPIARAHLCAVEEAQRSDPDLLLLDTDLVSTVTYSRHYYGRCPRWIEREVRVRLADLYLLHVPDLPWHPDPSRDRGNLRAEMHALFIATLREYAASVIEIAGSGPARVERAIAAIRATRAHAERSDLAREALRGRDHRGVAEQPKGADGGGARDRRGGPGPSPGRPRQRIIPWGRK